MAELVPVEGDPFAAPGEAARQLVPVDHDPFAGKQKSFSGTILPFTRDESGNVSFDPNAGIVGVIKRAVTLPSDVIAGKVQLPSSQGIPGSIDPSEPGAKEAMSRITEAATVMSPVSPAIRAGGAIVPGVTDTALRVTNRPPGAIEAAQTAVDLGAPLPRGIATENTGIQAITQGSRQLPYVGQKIGDRLSATEGAAGERLAGDTQGLTGGITARADVGESLRAPLKDIIIANKETIDTSFRQLRQAIDPEATVVPRNLGQALIEIGKSRVGSGWENPGAGLDNLVNLVRSGASFNGLQRARSELAETIDFNAAHGGFTAGDKKKLMGAISKDMEQAVALNVRPGVAPEQAIGLYKGANETFQKLVGENESVATILGSQRDTLLAGKIVSAANGKTGDPKLLAQLKRGLPDEDFNRVAGTVLHELGKNQSNEFSLNLFSKSWAQLGERQKDILFGPRKQFYDDIAHLSSFIKGTEQFKNTSNTGRAATIATVLSALGTGAATTIATGSPIPVATAAAGIAGGYALAKALANPAGAAAVARMARAAESYTKVPSVAKRATLMITARDAGKTLESLGSSGAALLRQLESPLKATPESDQQ